MKDQISNQPMNLSVVMALLSRWTPFIQNSFKINAFIRYINPLYVYQTQAETVWRVRKVFCITKMFSQILTSVH